MDKLIWLQNWYCEQCNGDWEHSYGIRIDTLDNPGWSVNIDLTDTNLDGEGFKALKLERTQLDWVHCSVDEGVFRGRGGALNLKEILEIFYLWVSER